MSNLYLNQIPIDSIKRKIRVTPSWGAYEYLWPMMDKEEFSGQKVKFYYSDYSKKIQVLKRIVPEEAKLNIQETKKMFDSIKWELHELYFLSENKKNRQFNEN